MKDVLIHKSNIVGDSGVAYLTQEQLRKLKESGSVTIVHNGKEVTLSLGRSK